MRQTITLTPEELAARLVERIAEIIDKQQTAYLKDLPKLETACEKYDVEGAVWDAVERLGDSVNHLGGPLADAQKLITALYAWVVDVEAASDAE